jgi:cytochrome c oxidase cbb3-type subunit III
MPAWVKLIDEQGVSDVCRVRTDCLDGRKLPEGAKADQVAGHLLTAYVYSLSHGEKALAADAQ